MGFFEDIGLDVAEEFDKLYAEAPVKRISTELPNGFYTGFIEDFKLMEGSNGKIYLRVNFVIMNPNFEGYYTTKWTWINLNEPEKTAKKLKTDMMILKYDWKGIRSLGDKRKWEAVKGNVVQFHVTHKDGYMNIWPRRTLRKITQEEKEKYRARCELPPE